MTLLSQQDRIHNEQFRKEDIVTKTADFTMNLRDKLVYLDSASHAIAVTLPPVAEAQGMFFTLYATAVTEAITFVAADSIDWATVEPTFNGADDGCVLYSDGRHWWVFGTRT
jgi:hypothetical protein